MVLLSTNPILAKIKYINRDVFDTTMGISGVLGKSFHTAMAVYYGGSDVLIPTNEAEAVEYGLKAGMEFLQNYNDGFIEYSATIPNKQKALELLSFCYQSYIKQFPYKIDSVVSVEEKIEEFVEVEWRDRIVKLPIKLKGYLDKIERSEDGKLIIRDYKTCYSFSNPDKIDGAKILQAVEYYFLAYAKYGEEPYSIIFDEVKYTKNRDAKEKQVKSYEIVFAENELYFDFYLRFYDDTIRLLNGEAVFLPNVHATFDNEVAVISYIHRLDIAEETAKLMKKHKVDRVSDLLKKEIQNAGNMRKLLKTVEEKFVSVKNIDYDKMSMEEKIQTKMLEYGIMLQFDSKIEGTAVDLYRYTPSMGVKMSRIASFVDDIEQVTGVSGIRVLAPIPNSKLVGFEVPRESRTFVSHGKAGTNITIGVDILGNPIELVVEEMPHLLVAGTTGSGKSVFLREVITQLSNEYEIEIIDPKGIEFEGGLSEHTEIAQFFMDLTKLMAKRYEVMKTKGVKKWSETGEKSLVVIIDEYNDLYMSREKHQIGTREIIKKTKKYGEKVVKVPEYDTVGNIVDLHVKKLAQKARSAGIHLILATQRPSVKVLDGDIKANFSTRISFRLPTKTDSNVVLDMEGAEKLLGKGDGLLLKDGFITRFQAFSN